MDGKGKPQPPERIRALLAEVDRVCAQAEFETRRLQHAMRRGAFWPERRNPRKWDQSEFGREAPSSEDRNQNN